MCGLYGYVGTDRRWAAPETLDRAVRALHHRGPDGDGTFRDDAGEVVCGLSHTRLAIIDLSPSGRQPRTTDDGRYTIVYNGELYNHAILRRELEAAGVTFRSSCDTEVALAAYARWGASCLTRLQGMFALAVWDARERSVFLARDRLGIKPLYYVRLPGGVAFASEVRVLLALDVVPRRLARAAVPGYLAFGSVACPATIIDGASSLPPAHALHVRGEETRLERYWEVPLSTRPSAAVDEEIARVREVLQGSVHAHLVADVPVGVFLSGGIDSSAMVSLAARSGATRFRTFTVTFDEGLSSEADDAAEIARRYGCAHERVHVPATRAADEIDEAVSALDQPSADGLNTYFVSKAARAAGLSVALSGLGGDEVFAGYHYFRLFAATRRLAGAMARLPALTVALRQLARSGRVPARVGKLVSLLSSGGRPEVAYAALRAMFDVDQRRALLSEAGLNDVDETGVTVPSSLRARLADGQVDAIAAYSALELSNYTANTLLRDCDAMSMAHSLEVRVPFLDHTLIEAVLQLPAALKVSRHANKPLLTAAVGDLPRDVATRRKLGFTLPLDTWFRGPLRPWMEAMLLDIAPRRLPFLRRAAVVDVWRSFLAGRASASRVWCIAALAAFCEANEVAC